MTVVLNTPADLLTDFDAISGSTRATGGTLHLEDGRTRSIAPRLLDAINFLLDHVGPDVVGHVEVDRTLVSPDRAGAILGVTRQTIYAWQDRGLIAREDVGVKRMVPWQAVEDFRADRDNRAAVRQEILAVTGEAATADAVAAKVRGSLDAVATERKTTTRKRPERRRHPTEQ